MAKFAKGDPRTYTRRMQIGSWTVSSPYNSPHQPNAKYAGSLQQVDVTLVAV